MVSSGKKSSLQIGIQWFSHTPWLHSVTTTSVQCKGEGYFNHLWLSQLRIVFIPFQLYQCTLSLTTNNYSIKLVYFRHIMYMEGQYLCVASFKDMKGPTQDCPALSMEGVHNSEFVVDQSPLHQVVQVHCTGISLQKKKFKVISTGLGYLSCIWYLSPNTGYCRHLRTNRKYGHYMQLNISSINQIGLP